MASTIDLALMAGASYVSNRPDEHNRFAVPNEWSQTRYENPPDGSGFEAVSFIKGNEIVISFAGTDFSNPSADFTQANVPLAAGVLAQQLKEAADYYLQIKAANPNAIITLTGHSLGGGLAALIAVMFDETAKTFDQAPFNKSASVGRISLRNPPDEKMLNILKSFKHLPTDNAALIRPTESHA